TLCLAGTGLMVLGAFFIVGFNRSVTARPTEATNTELTSPQQFLLPPDEQSLQTGNTQLLLAEKADGKAGPAAADAGWIGIMFDEKQDDAVRVGEVFPGGPAAFAGVRSGDVVLKIGAATPTSIAAAVSAIEGFTPRQEATLTVQRGKKKLELK